MQLSAEDNCDGFVEVKLKLSETKVLSLNRIRVTRSLRYIGKLLTKICDQESDSSGTELPTKTTFGQLYPRCG